MDPEHDAYKQIEAIVSESLLPQEYEMEYVKKCITVYPRYVVINPPCYLTINAQLMVVIYCVTVNNNHLV